MQVGNPALLSARSRAFHTACHQSQNARVHQFCAGSSELPHSTFSLPVGLAQQEPHACCFGDTALQTAQQLTKAVETGLNARNAVSIAQVYSLVNMQPYLPFHVAGNTKNHLSGSFQHTGLIYNTAYMCLCCFHTHQNAANVMHSTSWASKCSSCCMTRPIKQKPLRVLYDLQTYCVSCHSSGAQLHCHVAIPGAAVLLTPLYAKKVCQVPLSQPLQEGESSAALPQTGLLSMDQARSLLPLLSDDPNVSLACFDVLRIQVAQFAVASSKTHMHSILSRSCIDSMGLAPLYDSLTLVSLRQA